MDVGEIDDFHQRAGAAGRRFEGSQHPVLA
jgi:hypothetical protein